MPETVDILHRDEKKIESDQFQRGSMARSIVKLFLIIISSFSWVNANSETEKICGALLRIVMHVQDRMYKVSEHKTLQNLLEPYRHAINGNEKVHEAWSYLESNMDEITARFQPVYEEINPHDCLHGMVGYNLSYINTDSFRLLKFWDEFQPARKTLGMSLIKLFNKTISTINNQLETFDDCTEFLTIKENFFHLFNHLLIIDLKVLSVVYYDLLFYLPAHPRFAEEFIIPKIGKPHRKWIINYLKKLKNMFKIIPEEFEMCNKNAEQPEYVKLMIFTSEMFYQDWFKLSGNKKL